MDCPNQTIVPARVSVVIPCYNAGELIIEAIESALGQSYADLEVIVVDDGSTDARTAQILDGSAWPRTRIIRQQNSGPAAARNAAIRASTGEFILPLDADDTIEASYVEKAVHAIQSSPNIGIVYCRAMKFGAETGPWHLPAYNLRELVIDNVIFVTSLFRRADWERVGGFNQSLRMGVEDYEFWVKIVNLGREVVQLDEFLFNYRIQPASRTTCFTTDRSVVVDTYARIFRDNVSFFAQHAEYLFEHRFGLYDQISAYHRRYGKFEAFLAQRPLLRAIGRRLARLLGLC